MARSRDDDYDDDYDDRPAKKRRRDDDDDYDDRPSRRGGGGAMGPLDNMYANTNIVVLILFALCCNGIATILSLIAYLTGNPSAS